MNTIEGANGGGYLKPIKKGEVRNPDGRAGKDGKGGEMNMTTALKKILSGEVTVEEAGKKFKTDKRTAINMMLINAAMKGDLKAIDMVWDRDVGKATIRYEEPQGQVIINIKDD